MSLETYSFVPSEISLATVQSAFSTENPQLKFQLLKFLQQNYGLMEKLKVVEIIKFLLLKRNPEYFLQKQIEVLAVLLYKNMILTFPDIIGMLSINPLSSSLNLDGFTTFLEIFITLDEELDHHINKTGDQITQNTQFKDYMRQNDTRSLITTIILILKSSSSPKTIKSVLILVGLYVSWIDISLILDPVILETLYKSLSEPELQIQAIETLSAIISKGMPVSHKLNLLTQLDILNLISTAGSTEFQESMAGLVNTLGLELCFALEHFVNREDGIRAMTMLDPLVSVMITFLGNEYDEVSLVVLPFVNGYLQVLKVLKKKVGESGNVMPIPFNLDSDLRRLLETLVLKIKYDGEGYGDEDFEEFRKDLKVPFDTVSQLNPDLFYECVTGFVSGIYERVDTLQWMEAELGLYLTYLFLEGRSIKGIKLDKRRNE